MELKLTENDLLDAHFNGVAHGREIQKEESKKAHLAKLRRQQASGKPMPVKPKAETDKNSLATFDRDKCIAHLESENALAGLTTAKEINSKDMKSWVLEQVSESGTTKLTYIMPQRIKTHTVSTLLKIIQMYKKSGNLNGELVTTFTELARTGSQNPCAKSIELIFNDLEALAYATIKGEEIKNEKKIKWAGASAFMKWESVDDGIKITLSPRLLQSIEENWSFARIELNLRKELSSVAQDLHLWLSSWVRGTSKRIEIDTLMSHVFQAGGNLYWQRNRLKKALVELEEKGAFKHKLSKQMSRDNKPETMISIWK